VPELGDLICVFCLQVSAVSLSEEEIKGLKTLFANMDTNRSGTITYEQLQTGLSRLRSRLSETEVQQLVEAVSYLQHLAFSFPQLRS